MFYTIHRAIKLLLYGVVALVGWKIYEQRELFEPALIWVEVWDNGGFYVERPGNTVGRVKHVANSQTFTMSSRSGVPINVRLMGLREPAGNPREPEHRLALEEMIKGKWVHVEKLYESQNNLGGVVFVQGTNVNADLVRRGIASTSKEHVKTLPKEDQYSLLWARRHRVEK